MSAEKSSKYDPNCGPFLGTPEGIPHWRDLGSMSDDLSRSPVSRAAEILLQQDETIQKELNDLYAAVDDALPSVMSQVNFGEGFDDEPPEGLQPA